MLWIKGGIGKAYQQSMLHSTGADTTASGSETTLAIDPKWM